MVVKLHDTKTTLAAAITDAYEELGSLRDEVREVYEGMPESLQGGSRGGTLSETADTLDQFVDDSVDVPEAYADLTVSYGSNRRKSKSRADRRDEACRMLEASASAIQSQIEQLEESLEASPTDGDGDERENHISELRDTLNTIEEAQSNADGVEFPGMYG